MRETLTSAQGDARRSSAETSDAFKQTSVQIFSDMTRSTVTRELTAPFTEII
ncbi:MAG: hypothetical protein RBS02_07265 [Steroidobacteraceae bacterium]|jgi:hypothetical protein|nr:hypothetical protein [Steroidobacteraceae bacterium]